MRGTTEKAADILMRRIDGARRILARAGVERGKLETMIEAALRELADAEQHYRRMHDRHGSDSLDTGRAWVQMRRAGDAARAALAGEGEPTPHFPDEHGDCPSWCVGCQSAPPRRCFFPRCRCVSPSLGDCKGEKHSAPEVELPTAPGREGPCAACPHSGSEHLQFSGLCTECDCVEHEAIEVQP